jgi:hypothetical protein
LRARRGRGCRLAGAPGVRFAVPTERNHANWGVAGAKVVGDLSGDGVPDLAFAVELFRRKGQLVVHGENRVSHTNWVQVVFGGKLPSHIDLTSPRVHGFRIPGAPGDAFLGASLAGRAM